MKCRNNLNFSLFIQLTNNNINKMNEKGNQEYQSMDPEYVTELYSGASFETILLFDFCTVSKILICFSLIKRFPNDYKRYSSHLQVLILH